MPNPFFFGGHVTDPDKFVGRKAELRRIASLAHIIAVVIILTACTAPVLSPVLPRSLRRT